MDGSGANHLSGWLDKARHRYINGHDGRVFDLAFSCAGASPTLASASDDNTVRVWRVGATDQRLQQSTLCSGHQDSVLRVNWSKAGTMLASASADTTVQLWQLADEDVVGPSTCLQGKAIKTMQGHPEEVYACEFLEQNHLLTASADRLFLWDIETGACLQQASGTPDSDQGQLPARWRPGYIFSAEAQPGGTLVATACSDGVLRVWNCHSGQMQIACSIPLYRGMTAACAWDADAHCIASVATSGEMVVLDIRRQQPLWSASAGCSLRDCCYLPEKQGRCYLLAAAADGSLHSSYPSQGESALLASCKSHAESLLCVASSQDGHTVAMGGGIGRARSPLHMSAECQIGFDMADDDQFAISLYCNLTEL